MFTLSLTKKKVEWSFRSLGFTRNVCYTQQKKTPPTTITTKNYVNEIEIPKYLVPVSTKKTYTVSISTLVTDWFCSIISASVLPHLLQQNTIFLEYTNIHDDCACLVRLFNGIVLYTFLTQVDKHRWVKLDNEKFFFTSFFDLSVSPLLLIIICW